MIIDFLNWLTPKTQVITLNYSFNNIRIGKLHVVYLTKRITRETRQRQRVQVRKVKPMVPTTNPAISKDSDNLLSLLSLVS